LVVLPLGNACAVVTSTPCLVDVRLIQPILVSKRAYSLRYIAVAKRAVLTLLVGPFAKKKRQRKGDDKEKGTGIISSKCLHFLKFSPAKLSARGSGPTTLEVELKSCHI
jgi:hypothetical protein